MENARTIEATAADWFARRDSGVWRHEDQAEFDAWLNRDLAHRLAFIRVETAWQQAQRLKALRRESQRGEVPPVGEWKFSPFFQLKAAPRDHAPAPGQLWRATFGAWVRGAAAGIAFAAIVVVAWYAMSSRVPAYRTAVGGMETVPLSDGSVVTLNTNTEIRVALTRAARTIRLEGEAFFDVAKDPARPFVVDVGNERVIAIGTRFSVRREGEKVRVAVTDGQVLVEAKAGATQPAHLVPGDVASADSHGVVVRQKPVAAVEAEDLSWRNGYISFRDTPLGEVVKELNRYNTRKIRITDPGIAAIRIGGEFRVTNVDAFLRLIQQGVPIHATERGDEIVLQ